MSSSEESHSIDNFSGGLIPGLGDSWEESAEAESWSCGGAAPEQPAPPAPPTRDRGGASSRGPAQRGGRTSTCPSEGPAYEVSTTSEVEVLAIRSAFGIPSSFVTWAPEAEERACFCDPGVLAVYEDFLPSGLRFPIHPFVIRVLGRYKLVPAQLAPNAFRILTSFVVLCTEEGIAPRLSLFRVFYKLSKVSGSKGWYCFSPRKNLQLFKCPSSIKGWKRRFFFISSEEAWGFQTDWREPDSSPNLNAVVDPHDEKAFKCLVSKGLPREGDYVSEEKLLKAGISRDPGEKPCRIRLAA